MSDMGTFRITIQLGARSLVGLNLRFDARTRRVVGAGPIVTAAA